MSDLLSYLFGHPIGLWSLIALVAVGAVAWFASPVTWRDGEGRIDGDSRATASWLRTIFRILGW